MAKRKIEVFSAGCSICEETINLVKKISCPSCEVEIVDTRERFAANRARGLGIRAVPAVVVDGKLAACCVQAGPSEEDLRAAGIGQPL